MNLHVDHKKVNVCNVSSPPSGLRQKAGLNKIYYVLFRKLPNNRFSVTGGEKFPGKISIHTHL